MLGAEPLGCRASPFAVLAPLHPASLLIAFDDSGPTERPAKDLLQSDIFPHPSTRAPAGNLAASSAEVREEDLGGSRAGRLPDPWDGGIRNRDLSLLTVLGRQEPKQLEAGATRVGSRPIGRIRLRRAIRPRLECCDGQPLTGRIYAGGRSVRAPNSVLLRWL